MFAELFPDDQRHLFNDFGRMIAFDALIGAQDRHAENWSVVRSCGRVRLAPLYDTARGLFWNHPDSELAGQIARYTRAGYVERYAHASRPLIGCGLSNRANHFDLVEHAMRELGRELASPIRSVVASFDVRVAKRVIDGGFGRIFSPLRRHLIYELLALRAARLKRICGLR
jgi:hypothetical protein